MQQSISNFWQTFSHLFYAISIYLPFINLVSVAGVLLFYLLFYSDLGKILSSLSFSHEFSLVIQKTMVINTGRTLGINCGLSLSSNNHIAKMVAGVIRTWQKETKVMTSIRLKQVSQFLHEYRMIIFYWVLTSLNALFRKCIPMPFFLMVFGILQKFLTIDVLVLTMNIGQMSSQQTFTNHTQQMQITVVENEFCRYKIYCFFFFYHHIWKLRYHIWIKYQNERCINTSVESKNLPVDANKSGMKGK